MLCINSNPNYSDINRHTHFLYVFNNSYFTESISDKRKHGNGNLVNNNSKQVDATM